MAWKFRKRTRVFPGFYLNVSSRGVSTTIGARGSSINFGKNGIFLNQSIRGTGLYNRTKLFGNDEDKKIEEFPNKQQLPSEVPEVEHEIMPDGL